MRWTVIALLAAAAFPAQGAGFKTIFFFPAAQRPEDVNKTLVLQYRDDLPIDASNACAADECAKKYRLERVDKPFETFTITSAVFGEEGGFPTLTFALDRAPVAAKGLSLLAYDLIVVDAQALDPARQKKSLGPQTFPIAPQLAGAATDEGERFEALRNVQHLDYQSLTPMAFGNSEQERAAASKKVTVVDADPQQFSQPYTVYVDRIATVSKDHVRHQIDLTGIPRGKKVVVTFDGLETFAGQPLQAKATVQNLALPKGRDDSEVYANISIVADDVKNDRQYKYDVHLQDRWRVADLWDLGPTFDATLGNKSSKAPNTAALSFDFRRWLGTDFSTHGIHSASFVFSPIYRTDRAQANRDAGIDIAFEPFFTKLERPLVRRRAIEVANGGPPLVRQWGWRIRPSLALETGEHLRSSEPDVEHHTFERARSGLSAMVERGPWQLTFTGYERYLFEHEVVLDQGKVVRTAKGERRYARADLAYNFANVALTVTYLDGRQPPAFTQTHSTSFGIALKF